MAARVAVEELPQRRGGKGASHLASGMDCRAQSWMENEGRWRCCRSLASLGSCFPANAGRASCWPERRTPGRWHSGACAARSAVADCGSAAASYAWR